MPFAAVANDVDRSAKRRPIYLDYNATTPMAPEVSYAVAEAWLVFTVHPLTVSSQCPNHRSFGYRLS